MVCVLVVDDSSFMRMMLRVIFQERAYDVLEASNGVEAVDLYRANHPDVVTMDISMPTMDGFEATQAIFTEDPNAKIIFVTALDQEPVLRRAITMGVKEFIVKPFKPDQVWTALDHVLGSYS